MSQNETASIQHTADVEEELIDAQPPEMDVIFGVLRNGRRRLVLRYLEEDPSTTIGDLAEHIAAIENDVSREELRSRQRKVLYVALYQAHLPKLDAAGAISYDPDRGTVEAGPDIDRFLAPLNRFDAPERNPTRSRAVYTLSGAGLLGVALTVGLFSTMWVEDVSQVTLGISIALIVGAVILIARGARQ